MRRRTMGTVYITAHPREEWIVELVSRQLHLMQNTKNMGALRRRAEATCARRRLREKDSPRSCVTTGPDDVSEPEVV